MADVTPEEDAILRAALRASGKVVETAATRAAVAAARAEILPFLTRAVRLVNAMAGEGISFGDQEDPCDIMVDLMEAMGLEDMGEVVPALESGAPQRWAAEREGQGDG